ncbi:hypothetical protein HISP_19875 (plasmid) [Haloarcula hispanica N601]|uniref:Uncharacterized protein n=3 Tax=Haloarcula hispanica TaxID=51589 RepID=V5TT72_HALHI|nr:MULTISPECIES: hypothetical protein [Haloarcula]AEM59473.1 conserved hypothetical protein [Haloarcula hispanica ATCC 33960]AHB68318.1 hypothetical protein HISP_19875 [Haloarcula hispanica N601]AJF27688.1 hypothetical protein SG26_18170 [Haloarcula sp. CBA1115]KAA9404345.1 hypothetical protein Har1131_16230 [Haloarcula sp. CBA1131]KAA9404960.1 hypothetical protein EGO51_16625 [Haloarcula hispanica]
MAERYNTPAEGTLDWHVPLNENFEKLDSHVELRDAESNISQYEPKTGSKFLATDTGTVYIGDGSNWNRVGSLSASDDSVSEADDGSLIAPPGEVQSVIDQASKSHTWAQGPSRTVKLVSGENYFPSDTIKLKRNIRLECNGARIIPEGDFNVIEMYRGTQLIDPFIDTRSVNWNSTQVVVGAPDADKIELANRATVENAYLWGTPGEGIGLQFLGGSKPCSMQVASGTIHGFDIAIDLYASGDDYSGQGDWSNGNQFYGSLEAFRVGVNQRSEGAEVSGNVFKLMVQPDNDVSEWLWYMEDDPRSESDRDDNMYRKSGNTMMVYPWDNNNYMDNNPFAESSDRKPPVWYIGEGINYGNSLVDQSGKLGNQYIVNNSDYPDRNGIFTYHGGEVTGTRQFSHPPAYQRNSESRMWHEDSKN